MIANPLHMCHVHVRNVCCACDDEKSYWLNDKVDSTGVDNVATSFSVAIDAIEM